MKKTFFVLMTFVTCFLLSACAQTKTSNNPMPGGEPMARIDAPLNKMTLPLEAYEIVFHITDDTIVTLGELSINDHLVANLYTTGNAQEATLRYTWTPEKPGTYTIRVRGQNQGGKWSAPAEVTVEISTSITGISPTPTAEAIIIEKPTSAPTNAPTATSPAAEELRLYEPRISNRDVYMHGRSCGSNSVTFYVKIEAGTPPDWVSLNYRYMDSPEVRSTEWQAVNMTLVNPSTGEYSVTIQPDLDSSVVTNYVGGKIQYQFWAGYKNPTRRFATDWFDNILLHFCNH